MGKLLSKTEVTEHADWYFDDAYYSSSGGTNAKWVYPWPNKQFPNHVAIHNDEIDKVAIRKWIDNNDIGTVIYEYVSKSYRVWWSEDLKKREWDHTSEIHNCWFCFYFEDSEAALAFNLNFVHLVRPLTEDHPTRHHGERYHR
jgi:hypothetical protein